MQDPFDINTSIQPAMDHGAQDTGGNKRQHTSDTSDSDKDIGEITEENHLALISAEGRKEEEKKNLKKFLPV